MNDKDFTQILNKMLDEHSLILELIRARQAEHRIKQEALTESESSIVNRLSSITQKMEEQNIRYRRLVMNEPVMRLVK